MSVPPRLPSLSLIGVGGDRSIEAVGMAVGLGTGAGVGVCVIAVGVGNGTVVGVGELVAESGVSVAITSPCVGPGTPRTEMAVLSGAGTDDGSATP